VQLSPGAFMKEEEKIEEEVEEEVVEEESVIKKVILIVIAIAILILITSYVFVTFPIGDILRGRMESAKIENDVIYLGNLSIVFENNSYYTLKREYFGEQKTEFSLCLLGHKENSTYYITSMYQPETYSKTFSQVSFKQCSEDTLILLHTHPYKSCLASPEDIKTLNNTKKLNPDVLMVVMCEPERFSVYS